MAKRYYLPGEYDAKSLERQANDIRAFLARFEIRGARVERVRTSGRPHVVVQISNLPLRKRKLVNQFFKTLDPNHKDFKYGKLERPPRLLLNYPADDLQAALDLLHQKCPDAMHGLPTKLPHIFVNQISEKQIPLALINYKKRGTLSVHQILKDVADKLLEPL